MLFALELMEGDRLQFFESKIAVCEIGFREKKKKKQ